MKAGYDFTTEDRQLVRVRYANRTIDTSGADSRDAVLVINGQLVTGDIEFYVAATDWRRHGHYRDWTYNKVVLHVVMLCQAGEITCLENVN